MLSAWMIAATTAWALPPVPPPLAVSAEEATQLRDGQLVFREEASGLNIAILDVASSPDAVMHAVMDLAPRVEDIGSLLSFETYNDGPGRKSARWELGASVYSATFHVLYAYDHAKGWCVYTLDTSKENDISSVDGSYQVYLVEGGSRLVYRSQQQNNILPGWMMKKFARGGAEELLRGIAARAAG
jgi:hypothetical protein